MNNPLGISPSKGNQGATQAKVDTSESTKGVCLIQVSLYI